MDWSRAKNILIVAFLCLNLFLGYHLWLETIRYPAATGVAMEEILETQRYLEEAGFEVVVAIPREAPPLPLLKVQVFAPSPHQVAEHLLGTLEDTKAIRASNSQGEVLFVRPGEELSIYPNGIATYRYLDPQEEPALKMPGELTEEGVRLWAENYAARQEQFGQDFRVKEIQFLSAHRGYLVNLEQVYEGRPLVGSAGVEAMVTDHGVEFLWQRMLQPQGPAGENKMIIPATEALLRLAAVKSPLPEGDSTVIDEITLGYYNKLYDAQEWEAVPVWAIRTSDREWYYINAFTGERER